MLGIIRREWKTELDLTINLLIEDGAWKDEKTIKQIIIIPYIIIRRFDYYQINIDNKY
jgi:hypothetical protein